MNAGHRFAEPCPQPLRWPCFDTEPSAYCSMFNGDLLSADYDLGTVLNSFTLVLFILFIIIPGEKFIIIIFLKMRKLGV